MRRSRWAQVGVAALVIATLAACSSSRPGRPAGIGTVTTRASGTRSPATAGGTTTAAPTTAATTNAPTTTAPTTTSTTAPPSPGPGWAPAVSVAGRPVMWTRSLAVDGETFTAALFDRQSTSLVLHASGAISAAELSRVVGAFNGGFELSTGQSGMTVGGATSGVFQPGMAAVVTYADGSTSVGEWGRDVPAPGQAVVSARSNLHLLVDGGQPAADAGSVDDWGAVLRSVGSATARASLGQRADGDLVWVGSMSALPGPLADAQVAVGAVRAMELDINPEWVALFSFTNGTPQALLPGQNRPADTYVAGWDRDYFTVDTR